MGRGTFAAALSRKMDEAAELRSIERQAKKASDSARRAKSEAVRKSMRLSSGPRTTWRRNIDGSVEAPDVYVPRGRTRTVYYNNGGTVYCSEHGSEAADAANMERWRRMQEEKDEIARQDEMARQEKERLENAKFERENEVTDEKVNAALDAGTVTYRLAL